MKRWRRPPLQHPLAPALAQAVESLCTALTAVAILAGTVDWIRTGIVRRRANITNPSPMTRSTESGSGQRTEQPALPASNPSVS